MKQEIGERERSGLEGLRERIARYRQSRHPRAHLPARLWAEAAGWAKKLGPYGASRALGVSYESLRRKTPGKQASGGFVEFSGAQLLETTVGGVVELSDAAGVRLTIKLGGAVALDVAAVVAAFRGARR
ncbi:MAG: hypothetical protein FD161_4926 [Limisphaerales bacterium]|nr:MAG: hypothetical protein FD161_4926 [Limisphaerales bacterium]